MIFSSDHFYTWSDRWKTCQRVSVQWHESFRKVLSFTSIFLTLLYPLIVCVCFLWCLLFHPPLSQCLLLLQLPRVKLVVPSGCQAIKILSLSFPEIIECHITKLFTEQNMHQPVCSAQCFILASRACWEIQLWAPRSSSWVMLKCNSNAKTFNPLSSFVQWELLGTLGQQRFS